MVVIMAAILVLFGAKRIPEFAKGLGKAMHEFNKAKNEVTQELHNAMEEDRLRTPPPAPQLTEPSVHETDTATASTSINATESPQNSSSSPTVAHNHPPETVPKT